MTAGHPINNRRIQPNQPGQPTPAGAHSDGAGRYSGSDVDYAPIKRISAWAMHLPDFLSAVRRALP